MSEPAGDSAGEAGVGAETADAERPVAAPTYRGVALALAAALVLLAVLAGTAPFWASSLPWAQPAADTRVDQVDQELQQIRQEQKAASTARQQLDQRLAALAAKPAAASGEIGDLRQQVAKLVSGDTDLASQVAALGKAVETQRQTTADAAHRLAAVDQAVQAQAKTGDDLADRVKALEQASHREAASGSGDTAMLLALLQIRDALAAGRSFAAEYDALTAAARNRPQILSAAAPLAAPAKNGVASRAALAARLRRLAPAIAKMAAPEPDGDPVGWRGQLLARLDSLVRVRRIHRGSLTVPSGPDATLDTTEKALEEGDLAAAVAAIEKLGDGAGDAARPWLALAKERLAAERALQQTEAALAADIGASAKSQPAAGPPH